MRIQEPVVQWPRKAMFKQIPLSIAVVDRDFFIVEANAQFEKTHGPWKGRKCFKALKGRDRKCLECAAVKTFKDGKTRITQEKGVDVHGNPRDYMIHIAPYKDPRGNIAYIIEMSIDITDRVNLEKEYRLLFDNVPCFVSVIDKAFNVVDANELFKKTFSKKGAKYCYEMYKGRERVCGKCPAVKAFRTRKPYTSLQVGINSKGEKTHYMVTAAPFRTTDKEVISVIEMAQDISEVMKLQEQLQQLQREKLESERFAAVGQTVAGLAHGVKNILMGLEGGMYVVNSGFARGDSDLVTHGWEMLQNNIMKISTVVKEYLQFARGSETKVEMTSPARVARDVFDLYHDSAQRAGIDLVADIQESIADAPLDHEGIHTCLANLVSNAMDACNLSEKKKKRITISCSESAGTIYYAVEDNGTGMDYEVKKKLFTNFFTTKPSGQGTGLGLLVTRRIIHEHGGTISFESAVGKGSLFRIVLPRKRLPKIRKEEIQ